MNHRWKFIWVLVSLFSISIYGEITGKMLELQQSLVFLLTKTSTSEKYSNPFLKKEIEKNLKSFLNLSHRLNQELLEKYPNPVVPMIPETLSSVALESYLSFREGHIDYSRALIRSAMNTCITCHTQTDEQFRIKESFFNPDPSWSIFEKAQFLMVSRKYNEAFDFYLKSIQDPNLDRRDLEDAISQSMLISLQIQDEPKKALRLAETLIHEKHIPMYLKVPALEWRKTLIQKINKRKKNPETEAELFREAEKWLKMGNLNQKFPNDRRADVHYRIASGLLNELIQKHQSSTHLSRYFYMQGICYDAINPKSPKILSNLYFESCIRRSPHTEISEECYRKFEENIHFAYSSNTGIHLPDEVKDKLVELWGISMQNRRMNEVKK